MPLFTFCCSNGHSFDALRGRDSSSLPCPECALPAERQSVYRIGVTGFAVTPLDQRQYNLREYQEATGELSYQHERAVDATQNANLPTPPLWQMAKARAKKLQKLGVKDSSQLKDVRV